MPHAFPSSLDEVADWSPQDEPSDAQLVAEGVKGLLRAPVDIARRVTDAVRRPDEVREAIPKIERVSGLTFRSPPKVEARSSDEVRAFLEQQFAEEATQRDLDGQVAAYKRFGLLADTVDNRRFRLRGHRRGDERDRRRAPPDRGTLARCPG